MALFNEAAVALGGEFVPTKVFNTLNWPEDHPMRLAIAYDLWRLGDYGASKLYLSDKLGFEPLAPPCEYP